MNKEEALNVIKQACASVNGNLQVHEQIQNAIKVIEDKLKEKKLDK